MTSSWSWPDGDWPLRVEHADHRERHVLDADDLAEGSASPNRLLRHGLAEQRDLGGAVDVLRGEEAARDAPASRARSK